MTLYEAGYESEELAPLRSPGCCSAYALPPLVVLIIAVGALRLAFGLPETPLSASAAALPSASTTALSPVFTPEVQHWAPAITAWSAAAGLEPNLAATVMQIESCGDPRALSRAGAMGLFQVMPYHFANSEQPFSPATNAARGLAYLRRALDVAQGDARLALAGYNGGIGVIGRAEWSWPDETVRYAYWGSGIYADASSGLDASPRLDEWLSAGGASLCRTARQRLGLAQ
jgi:soluble lytic murein transglycosylase-like protein